jgi:hypothetical protein
MSFVCMEQAGQLVPVLFAACNDGTSIIVPHLASPLCSRLSRSLFFICLPRLRLDDAALTPKVPAHYQYIYI